MQEQRIAPRYLRHEEFIPVPEQAKLATARILLAGVGAGSNLPPFLARYGYSTREPGLLTFADPDRVEVTNLNRQAFLETDIGKNKAEAMRERVLTINSDVKTRVVKEGITLKNVGELVSGADVIVDMVDIGVPKYMLALHREAQKQQKPLVTGFDLGEGATVLVFDYKDPKAMTIDQFLGLENVSLEDLDRFSSAATTAIAAQCLIGPTGSIFANSDEAQQYYEGFFGLEENVDKLKAVLPLEMHAVIDKLIIGELEYIPQMNSASVSIGNYHEMIVRRLVNCIRVRTVPDVIRLDPRIDIEPELVRGGKVI